MKQSVIVWDLETVPDLGGFAGLPGKPKGFDGGEVERYFREGKIKEVADYCETDVVGTYQVRLSRYAEPGRVRGERTQLRGLTAGRSVPLDLPAVPKP